MRGQDVEYTATFEVFPTRGSAAYATESNVIEKPTRDGHRRRHVDDIIEVFRKQQGELGRS